MTRPISGKVQDIRAALTTRLQSPHLRPGDRFLSARAAALEFAVSYQTAHRLLSELCEEGMLERRAGSGTYIPGPRTVYDHVSLCFDSRARRVGSFGARLLSGLTRQLDREGIVHHVQWAEEEQCLSPYTYPVLWQSPEMAALCRESGRPALLLNERPAPGLESTLLDSVSLGDFFGGACAAELLLRRQRQGGRFAIVTGPNDDSRSNARRDGFLSITSATVINAGGWHIEDGLTVAEEALTAGEHGIFCCNDRLAEAILRHSKSIGNERPRLVGFDNAPVAERLNLTTIAIPWQEVIADTIEIIGRRLSGDTSAARQRIITPYPIIRQ